MDDATVKGLEEQLDLSKTSLDSLLQGGEQAASWLARDDSPALEWGEEREGGGAQLRQLQSWLKENDPAFGGLVRVLDKRHSFRWAHPEITDQY
ncbi:MAG: hypothetical protein ACK41W_08990 [Cyanobacteriota bacterium]